MTDGYPPEIIWKKEVLDQHFEVARKKVDQEFANLKISTAKFWGLPPVEEGPHVLLDLSESIIEIGIVAENFSQSCFDLANLYLEYYKLNFE